MFCFKKASASDFDRKVLFNFAVKTLASAVLNWAEILKDASAENLSISRSRSTINRTATD